KEYDSTEVMRFLVNPPRPIPPDDDGRYCPPGDGPVRGDCLDYICNHLGSFGCNTKERVTEVANQCRNVSATCIRSVCSRLGTLNCNDREEYFDVARVCRGVYDGRCIDFICSKLSSFDCNDISEIE